MIRNPEGLIPEVRAKVQACEQACANRGVELLFYCTFRSADEQAELHRIGRELPGKIVTNAEAWQSWHNYKRAGDGVPLVYGKADWNPFASKADEMQFRKTGDLKFLKPNWRIFAEEAEKAGLEWAGRWKTFREYAHVQDTGGLTLAQAYEAFSK